MCEEGRSKELSAKFNTQTWAAKSLLFIIILYIIIIYFHSIRHNNPFFWIISQISFFLLVVSFII